MNEQPAATEPDLPTDWWTTQDVLTYLASVGAPIARGTWATYVARGQAPAAEKRIGAYPLWRPAAVREWQAARRGPGRYDRGQK